DLLFFSFDSSCCSDLEHSCHLFNVDTDKLASIAKNAATNDAIEMWHYEGEKKMNIKIFSKKGVSIHTINMKQYVETSVFTNHPTLEAEKSNFNERLETFTDACSTLTKSKSVSATTDIKCHPSCIIMESDNPQGGQHPFGKNIEDLSPEPFV